MGHGGEEGPDVAGPLVFGKNGHSNYKGCGQRPEGQLCEEQAEDVSAGLEEDFPCPPQMSELWCGGRRTPGPGQRVGVHALENVDPPIL